MSFIDLKFSFLQCHSPASRQQEMAFYELRENDFFHKNAEEHFTIAIKTAGEIGAKSVLGQAYLGLGQLHKSKGKTEKVRECISNAIDTFEKCEADVFLKQAREILASL